MPSKLQDIRRASKVIKVLWKHGFGRIIYDYGLQPHLSLLQKVGPTAKEIPKDVHVKLRLVLEELGGAYIKLGQLLSIRPDLIPQEYCDEFKKLQDSVEPVPFNQIQVCIEKCMGKQLNEVYSFINKTPIGSASIAQVYRARLKNKKDVVIKVQRPFAREKFEEDIDIMRYIAKKLDPKFKDTVPPTEIVKEFERYTQNELDFMHEARSIDRFYHAFENDSQVAIPHVYWQYSNKNVLTMEYIDGRKLSELDAKFDKKKIAQTIVEVIVKQIYEHGIFHADLHPGNILIFKNDKIGLLDFGIIGSLTKELRMKSLEMFVALINDDSDKLCDLILQIGTPSQETDVIAFKHEVEFLVDEWFESGNRKAMITFTLYKIMNTSIKYKIKLPVDILLYAKSFVTVEGTCLGLVPGFNFVDSATPSMIKIMEKEHTPRAIITKFVKKAKSISEAISEIPQEIKDFFEKVKAGKITFDLKDTDIKHLGMDINLSSNRLSFAMITAALVIAGALFINVKPLVSGYSLFSLVFLALAFVLLSSMIVSIFREGKEPFDSHRKI